MAKDKLVNGTALGAIVGITLFWGSGIRDWIMDTFSAPSQLSFLGDLGLPLIVIGIFTLAGYLIDKY